LVNRREEKKTEELVDYEEYKGFNSKRVGSTMKNIRSISEKNLD
jgi:deoxyhypusine synthase